MRKLFIYLIVLTALGANSSANAGPVYYSACDSNWVSLQQFCSEATCESLVVKNECGCDSPVKEAKSPSKPAGGGGSGGMGPGGMSAGGGPGLGFGPGLLVPGALVAFASQGSSSSPKTILWGNPTPPDPSFPDGGNPGEEPNGGSGGQDPPDPPPIVPGDNGQTHLVPEASSIWVFGIFAVMMGHWAYRSRTLSAKKPHAAA